MTDDVSVLQQNYYKWEKKCMCMTQLQIRIIKMSRRNIYMHAQVLYSSSLLWVVNDRSSEFMWVRVQIWQQNSQQQFAFINCLFFYLFHLSLFCFFLRLEKNYNIRFAGWQPNSSGNTLTLLVDLKVDDSIMTHPPQWWLPASAAFWQPHSTAEWWL